MNQSKVASWLVWLAMVCAFVGFLDATYLTASHLAGKVPTCTISGDCAQVLTSSYSKVAGVPLALFGMAYYAAAVLLGIAYIDRLSPKTLAFMLYLSFAGMAGSGFLVYLQLGVLHSVCAYCMISALCCLGYTCALIWALLLSPGRANRHYS